jgi:uncharacterized membrane protein YuzA (DUF378 family)
MNLARIGNVIYFIAALLVVVGGLNWLMVGLGKENFVDTLFKKNAKTIYVLVGISAVFVLVANIMLIARHRAELPFESA